MAYVVYIIPIMMEKIKNFTAKIAIIGLGYVGLPLAVEFGRKFDVVGFDVKTDRLEMLRRGIDVTLETSSEDLKAAEFLRYSNDINDLRDRDIFIVTVPTPVDEHNHPDLTPLIRASETVGKVIRQGGIVIYACGGAFQRSCIQHRIFLRVQSGTDQPRRQDSYPHSNPESRFRLHA